MKKLVVLFIALVATTTLWAYDFQVNGIYYNYLNTKQVEVTSGYNKYSGQIRIPSSVTYDSYTYKVVGIGDKAFADCKGLVSITIPNTIKEIRWNAFSGCLRLASVTIPNSVTEIGSGAFRDCSSLTSITIPNSVTSIGGGAFKDCDSLNTINIVANSIEEYCQSSINQVLCDMRIYLPRKLIIAGKEVTDLVIPNSVSSIGKSAFSYCTGLKSITIPNCVINIGKNAFTGCKGLISVTIPNSVTSIGDEAFNSCEGLASVTLQMIPNSIMSVGYRTFLGCDSLRAISIAVNSIEEYLLSSVGKLLDINMPRKIVIAGKELKDLVIPNSVSSLEERAFWRCSGLTSVTIPNSVKSIGENAFAGCSGLTSVTIPNSVTSIGQYAFSGCSGLTSVTWNAKNCADLSYSYYAPFYDVRSQITSFTIGDSVQHIPAYLCYDMKNLKSITIPSSVTSIGYWAFLDCDSLNTINIVANSIEEYCQSSINQVLCDKGIYLPRKLIIAGKEVTDLVIPNSVSSIGKSAFSYCTGLKSITIPNCVINIGENAFTGCTSLAPVIIPKSHSKKVFRIWEKALPDYIEIIRE